MRTQAGHEPSPLARLQRDASLPKALRAQLQAVSAPPPEPTSEVTRLAQAVADLRWVAEARPREAHHIDALVADYVRAALAAGSRPLGATAAEADAAALSMRLGAWIEAGRLPDGAEVVSGGFMCPAFYVAPEPEVADAPGDAPKRSRLFQLLSGAQTAPTPWTRYLEAQDAAIRPRLSQVRLCLERTARLIGVEGGSWCNDHHFAFMQGPPLGFSWRAWGDLVVAIQGHGEYEDWYW
jgi:hypothetical protein